MVSIGILCSYIIILVNVKSTLCSLCSETMQILVRVSILITSVMSACDNSMSCVHNAHCSTVYMCTLLYCKWYEAKVVVNHKCDLLVPSMSC